jgi:Fanconi anemia group D2 protein
MESFIYQVKAMLRANNCQASFWQGNLKQRDLDGNVIASAEERPKKRKRAEAAEEDE